MPKKVRELIRQLERAGWTLDRCKGDHRQFKKGTHLYTISGGLSKDAKHYQEKEVAHLTMTPRKKN
ncbi:MAG: type II toxin-antitoxin system HicA family toxin [Akkermansia sp.]